MSVQIPIRDIAVTRELYLRMYQQYLKHHQADKIPQLGHRIEAITIDLIKAATCVHNPLIVGGYGQTIGGFWPDQLMIDEALIHPETNPAAKSAFKAVMEIREELQQMEQELLQQYPEYVQNGLLQFWNHRSTLGV